MAGLMMALGKITTCMGMVITVGVMAVSMRASTTWTRSMGTESTTGLMEGGTKATGKMVSSTEKASTSCQMGSQR